MVGGNQTIPIIIIGRFSRKCSTGNIISLVILPILSKTGLFSTEKASNMAFTDVMSPLYTLITPVHNVLFYDMLARQHVAGYVTK